MTLSGTSDPKFPSFLENFPLLCPNLKSIKFDFLSQSPLPVTTTQSLSRAICGHGDWQRVELACPIDIITLKHLGMSPTLKAVSLTLGPETTRPDEDCFGDGDTPFRNVTKLALRLWNLPAPTTAMHLLRGHDQAFHSFNIIFLDTQITAMELPAFLRTIASPRRIDSLQSLVVKRPRHPPFAVSIPTSEIQGLSYETLCPIAPLVHLRELVIDLNHPISIDDEELASLVCNWPCLEVLFLTGMRGKHPAKSITLKGLLSLLVSCPKLREIGMSLDARHVPSDVRMDVCRPLVSRLTFQDSPIEHPELVEEFLFKHLPCVPGVDVSTLSWFGDLDHSKRFQLWTQVNACRNRRLGSE